MYVYIRLGTAAGTTRSFREPEFGLIGNLIADLLADEQAGGSAAGAVDACAAAAVRELCGRFPIY